MLPRAAPRRISPHRRKSGNDVQDLSQHRLATLMCKMHNIELRSSPLACTGAGVVVLSSHPRKRTRTCKWKRCRTIGASLREGSDCRPGDVLFQAGERGTSLFILIDGELGLITRQGEDVRVLSNGV